jgi:hypothetical protein
VSALFQPAAVLQNFAESTYALESARLAQGAPRLLVLCEGVSIVTPRQFVESILAGARSAA